MSMSHVSVHSSAFLPFFLIKLNLLIFLAEGSTSISTETLFFILRLWVQILSLSSPSKEAVAQRLTGHQSASGRCWMLAFASLGFFPQFFLDSSVFILTHEFFSLFLFQFFPASHYGGGASDWWVLSCWPVSTHHIWRKSWTFFPKIPLIWSN